MRSLRRRAPRPRRKDGTFKSHDHRTHPRKLKRPGPGTCTWCLSPILGSMGLPDRRKTFCDQMCVTAYLLRTDPALMRQHIFFRDGGRCADCGVVWRYMGPEWQADHILPLYQAFGDPSYWEPENVQLLCTDPCHKRKSAADLALYGRSTKVQAPPKRVRLAQRLS